MTWSRTDFIYPLYEWMSCELIEYLFSAWTDDPVSERMTCSQSESLFSVRNIFFVSTLYIRPDCLFPVLVRLTPRTIDSPYEWLTERMTQLCVLTYADLVPNRLSILRTNGWLVPGQNINSPYEGMTPLSEQMTCSKTESPFSVRNTYFVLTFYIRPDCLFPVRMTPRTIDSPNDWLNLSHLPTQFFPK